MQNITTGTLSPAFELLRMLRAKDNFARQPSQADQNQVWSCSLNAFYCVSFISGQGDAITVRDQ